VSFTISLTLLPCFLAARFSFSGKEGSKPRNVMAPIDTQPHPMQRFQANMLMLFYDAWFEKSMSLKIWLEIKEA
jgi:hypothetical protein